MPSFVAGSFALAGLIAAAAPLVIHLLNRRRYRVVDWAAMELLREALSRNKRLLHLRDLLLLALRTVCVLLFGLALARPFLSASSTTNDANQPVHAVLIVDNSLSMGYQKLDGTLLGEAKARLNEFLDRLPLGSRISVIPACGSTQAWSQDAYRTISDAREALARIEVVDRSAGFAAAVDLAVEACSLVPELPTKRVVFAGDQQRLNWPAGGIEGALASLPDVQIVQVAPDEAPANAWVADFRLQDDIADVNSPAIFTATIRYDGPSVRKDVEAVLTVEGVRVAAQTIDLEPGQARQLRFSHQFDVPVEPGEPVFVSTVLSLAPDLLPADDARFLVVPVVAALSVLFVDQYGAGEEPQKNRYGETYHLRRLLAPVGSHDDLARRVVSIRHTTPDRVDRDQLADCRLVVVAGIENPLGLVPALREYVEQGGQLFIAAGGNFDPRLWSARAFCNGEGILPLPLKDEPIGRLPDESAERLTPFFLSPDSMTDERFLIADASREELDDLYRTPLFFKAVAVDAGKDALDTLLNADIERYAEISRSHTDPKDQGSSDDAAKSHAIGEQEHAQRWLLWGNDAALVDDETKPETIARRQQPQVLASFSNGAPFLVERRVGRGDIIFVSTGVLSGWNNLTRTNAVVLLDRLLRSMLARTLPRRNYGTGERVVVPVPLADRRSEFSLARPGGLTEGVFVDAVGPESFAIGLRNLMQRGNYRVLAERFSDPASPTGIDSAKTTGGHARMVHADRLWQIELAVNGPSDESDLKAISELELRDRLGNVALRWLARGETIKLEGATVRGQEIWKWLMAGALVCLLLELAIVVRGQVATSNMKLRQPDLATVNRSHG
jgi:hypothetical protein